MRINAASPKRQERLMHASFDMSVVTQNAHLIWLGLLITLYYTVVTIAAGMLIGLFIGLLQLTGNRVLSIFGRCYVELFRNIPLLVILLWTYYALPIFLGIDITKGWAGFAALSCYIASFYAEILRAGVQSIDVGQSDAATALGMSYGQRMRRIILPQAFRRMVPPLAGQSIIQMKNTTLLSMITIPDLLYQAGYVSSFTYRPMEIYTAVGVIFLAILTPLTVLSRRLELREDRSR
jgi:polar amino acid transport system permease protein